MTTALAEDRDGHHRRLLVSISRRAVRSLHKAMYPAEVITTALRATPRTNSIASPKYAFTSRVPRRIA